MWQPGSAQQYVRPDKNRNSTSIVGGSLTASRTAIPYPGESLAASSSLIIASISGFVGINGIPLAEM
jgi:hypothetical protein